MAAAKTGFLDGGEFLGMLTKAVTFGRSPPAAGARSAKKVQRPPGRKEAWRKARKKFESLWYRIKPRGCNPEPLEVYTCDAEGAQQKSAVQHGLDSLRGRARTRRRLHEGWLH